MSGNTANAEPQVLSFDVEEIAVLKIVLAEAHRYGTLRASNPVLKKLQEQFAQLANKRTVRALKSEGRREPPGWGHK